MLSITNTTPVQQQTAVTNFKGKSNINNSINKLERNIIAHEKDASYNGSISEKILNSINESMDTLRYLAENLMPSKVAGIAEDFSKRVSLSKDITTDYLTSGYMKNILEANQKINVTV